ncbi:MAG: hypothetical protein NC080_07385 [Paraprevotella sp.]|nr:hypothetical protein [Paraprevotella sp.]
MNFTINRFSGSIPRLADHLAQTGSASVAVDCDFSSGRLASFREPAPYRKTAPNTKATFLQECCWHDFEGCVDLAYGSVTCKQCFVTGLEEYPVVLSVSDNGSAECSVEGRRLGIPCPTSAPSVFPGAVNDAAIKDVEGRSYAYQYINSVGERSGLSPGSSSQNLKDGQTVVVSGWKLPGNEYDISTIAIYRTVSSYVTGNEQSNGSTTVWMLVAEVPASTVSYSDSKRNVDLSIALTEDLVVPPPNGLRGIIWVESMNCLMGFIGNRVYASENGSYHNWPYYYDLDDNVCALCESNGLVYVATDGRPYVLAGAVDCDNAGCREIIRLPGSFPMVGCGNRRMAKCRAGAVYPSHNGLILLAGRSAPVILTWSLYSEREWQELKPQTLTPVEVSGKLYVFGEGGSFYMTMASSAEQGWGLDFHCSLSDKNVTDAFVTRQGDFYVVKDGIQYLWNRGNRLRPHSYVSREAVADAPVGWGAGNIFFTSGTESVRITLDDRIILDREVLSSRVFRLPMYAIGQRMKVELYGTGDVSLLSIASSMKDLRS